MMTKKCWKEFSTNYFYTILFHTIINLIWYPCYIVTCTCTVYVSVINGQIQRENVFYITVGPYQIKRKLNWNNDNGVTYQHCSAKYLFWIRFCWCLERTSGPILVRPDPNSSKLPVYFRSVLWRQLAPFPHDFCLDMLELPELLRNNWFWLIIWMSYGDIN